LQQNARKRTGGSGLQPTVNTSLMLPPGLRPGMSVMAIVVSDGYQLEIRQEFQLSQEAVEAPRGIEK